MPEYKSYPTVKEQRSRMARKRARQEIFEYNRSLGHTIRKERQKARKEAEKKG